MKLLRTASTAISIFAGFGLASLWAAPSGNIWQSVAICDPWQPTNCIKPAADGSIPVTGGGGGGGGGTSSNFGSSFPTAGTAAGFSDGTNMVAGRASSGALADNTVPPTGGILLGQAFEMVFNGTNWDRKTVGTAGSPASQVVTVQGISSGTALTVGGNVASGATDSGNPIKIGGIYNTTVPTLTNGQRGDLQIGSRGSLAVQLMGSNLATAVNFYVAQADGTSGVNALGVSNFNYIFNGTNYDRSRSINGAVAAGTGTAAVAMAPTSASAGGISAVVSPSAEGTRVLKAGAGNLYSAYATNLTATAGFLVVVNATSAPADGAITPLACVPLPENGNASINYGAGPPQVYSTGITVVLTSASSCFTKTTGTLTGFISGNVM